MPPGFPSALSSSALYKTSKKDLMLGLVTFIGAGEKQHPILAIHPCKGRALTVSRPAEQRPMSPGGSLRPSQAEAVTLLPGRAVSWGQGGQLEGLSAHGDNPLIPVTMRFNWRLEHWD